MGYFAAKRVCRSKSGNREFSAFQYILLMLLWILYLRYPNYCGANLVQCKSTNRSSDRSVGQAGAIRLAISRALLNFEDSYLEPLQQGLIITPVFKVIRNV